MATVSLLFPAGERPRAADIRRLADADSGFSISIERTVDEGWLELLANGLTYDVNGLSPHVSSAIPPINFHYALPNDFAGLELEAITILPGPHLMAGGNLFPVVRGLAILAANLCTLPKLCAVVWHSAGAASDPKYFRRAVKDWIKGGVFPGLGLTAIASGADGGFQSQGLALFAGQELQVLPGLAESEAEGAKILLRLINWLVEYGKVEERVAFTGPSGEAIQLEPVEGSDILRVWRGAN